MAIATKKITGTGCMFGKEPFFKRYCKFMVTLGTQVLSMLIIKHGYAPTQNQANHYTNNK